MKRGTDHYWRIFKYRGNMAIYAKCKCGYEFNCSVGTRIPPVVTFMHRYCPNCGARKKSYYDSKEIKDYTL